MEMNLKQFTDLISVCAAEVGLRINRDETKYMSILNIYCTYKIHSENTEVRLRNMFT